MEAKSRRAGGGRAGSRDGNGEGARVAGQDEGICEGDGSDQAGGAGAEYHQW